MTAVPALLREPLDRLARDASVHQAPSSAPKLLDVSKRPRSIVARVEVAGRHGPERVYLKRIVIVDGGPSRARVEQRLLNEQALAHRLETALEDDPALGAMRHVALYPDLLTVVTAEVPGEPLVTRIERATRPFAAFDESLEPIMRGIARWLRVFQALEPTGPAIPVSELSEYIKVRLDRLAAAPLARWSDQDTAGVLERAGRLGEATRPGDLSSVLIHADLAVGNILVERERVTVIDLSMARTGSRYHDLARLHAQLEQVAMKPWYSGARIARLQRVLLDAFEPGLTREAPAVELHLLLHRVNQFAGLARRGANWVANPWDARVALAHRRWLLGRIAAERAALCPES